MWIRTGWTAISLPPRKNKDARICGACQMTTRRQISDPLIVAASASAAQKMGVTSSGSCEEIARGTNTITVTNTLMAIDCG